MHLSKSNQINRHDRVPAITPACRLVLHVELRSRFSWPCRFSGPRAPKRRPAANVSHHPVGGPCLGAFIPSRPALPRQRVVRVVGPEKRVTNGRLLSPVRTPTSSFSAPTGPRTGRAAKKEQRQVRACVSSSPNRLTVLNTVNRGPQAGETPLQDLHSPRARPDFGSHFALSAGFPACSLHANANTS